MALSLSSIRVIRATLWAGGLLLGSACAQPDFITVPFDPDRYFAALTVRETAVTLALATGADTAQLHVTATLGDGTPVLDQIQFTAGDSTITVDSTGLVKAQFATNLAVVRVAVTHAGVTRRDSVQLRVLATPPSVFAKTISVQVPPGKSAVIPALLAPTSTQPSSIGQLPLVVGARDVSNASVPDAEILIDIRSSDTMVAVVDQSGMVTARRPGVFTITATAVSNGRFLQDSISLRIGLPLYVQFTLQSPGDGGNSAMWRLGGDTARIAAGGMVVWGTKDSTPIDLLFDDTTNIMEASAFPMFGAPATGRGHIRNFAIIQSLPDGSNFLESLYSYYRARSFPVPGVYRFRGVLKDSTVVNRVQGVILVCIPTAIVCSP